MIQNIYLKRLLIINFQNITFDHYSCFRLGRIRPKYTCNNYYNFVGFVIKIFWGGKRVYGKFWNKQNYKITSPFPIFSLFLLSVSALIHDFILLLLISLHRSSIQVLSSSISILSLLLLTLFLHISFQFLLFLLFFSIFFDFPQIPTGFGFLDLILVFLHWFLLWEFSISYGDRLCVCSNLGEKLSGDFKNPNFSTFQIMFVLFLFLFSFLCDSVFLTLSVTVAEKFMFELMLIVLIVLIKLDFDWIPDYL